MDILPFFDRKLIGGKFKVRGDDCNLNFFSVFRRFVSLLARHVLAKVPPKSNACSNNHCADYPPPCIVVIHFATPPPNSRFTRFCGIFPEKTSRIAWAARVDIAPLASKVAEAVLGVRMTLGNSANPGARAGSFS